MQPPSLPQEVLDEIVSYLGARQTRFTDDRLFDVQQRSSTLCSLALTCKALNDVATTLLYESTRVTSYASLVLLLHTFQSSPALAALVRRFTYQASSRYLKQLLPIVAAENYIVIDVISLLGEGVIMDLKLTEPFLISPNFAQVATRLRHQLTAVHLVLSLNSSCLGPSMAHVTLPNLTKLTMEFATLDNRVTWPHMPGLRELCLHNSSLLSGGAGLDLDPMRALTRLEILNLMFTGNSLELLLEACSGQLEHLSLLDVVRVLQNMTDFSGFHRLRTLCIAVEDAMASLLNLTMRYPESLEKLTLLERAPIPAVLMLLSPESVIAVPEDMVTLTLSLEKLIELPRLTWIRVRGRIQRWGLGREAKLFTTVFESSNIFMELSLF